MCFEQPDRLNAKVFINFGYDQLKIQTLVLQTVSILHNWNTHDIFRQILIGMSYLQNIVNKV